MITCFYLPKHKKRYGGCPTRRQAGNANKGLCLQIYRFGFNFTSFYRGDAVLYRKKTDAIDERLPALYGIIIYSYLTKLQTIACYYGSHVYETIG